MGLELKGHGICNFACARVSEDISLDSFDLASSTHFYPFFVFLKWQRQLFKKYLRSSFFQVFWYGGLLWGLFFWCYTGFGECKVKRSNFIHFLTKKYEYNNRSVNTHSNNWRRRRRPSIASSSCAGRTCWIDCRIFRIPIGYENDWQT